MPFSKCGNGESPGHAELQTPTGGRPNGHAVKEAMRIDIEHLGPVPAPDRLIASAGRDDEPSFLTGKRSHRHFGAAGFVRDVGDPQPVR